MPPRTASPAPLNLVVRAHGVLAVPATGGLTDAEVDELLATFRYLTNYDSDDPAAPVDPLTYRAPDGDTCLHVAALRNDARSVSLLLKAGLDVNAPGDMGSTPLHYATDRAVIDMLLASGASREVENKFGRTPLEGKDY